MWQGDVIDCDESRSYKVNKTLSGTLGLFKIYLHIYLNIYLSIRPPIHPSVRPSIHPSTIIYLCTIYTQCYSDINICFGSKQWHTPIFRLLQISHMSLFNHHCCWETSPVLYFRSAFLLVWSPHHYMHCLKYIHITS